MKVKSENSQSANSKSANLKSPNLTSAKSQVIKLETQELFNRKKFLKKLLKISVPVALQNLMLALVAAADAFMLGRLDQDSMAAVSLATQIQFVQNLFIGGAVGTVAILGAQYWGKKDLKSLNFIFALTLKICFVISILFWALCIFIPKNLMLIFTNQDALVQIGIRYLKIAGWSYILSGISQVYLAIMKVSDHTGLTAIISSVTVVLNIILNAILIFGLFGVKAFGVEGAAIATLIARTVELIWCIIASYCKDFIYPHLKSFFEHNSLLIKDFLKCMMPLLLAFILWGVGFTSYSAFMGHLGTDATAAASVAAVVRDLVCCFCNGLSTGAGIIVGNELGAGNLERGKLYGQKIRTIALLCGIFSALIMGLLSILLFKSIKLSLEAQKYLIEMMAIMSFYMIGRAVNSILINGVFDCGGDTLFDMYSLAICMWGIAIPLAALGTFVFHWPVLLIYACTCLDEVGKIPWTLYHFKKYKWVKNLTR